MSLGQQPQYKRRRINLLVPIFIFCNLLAIIAYTIIILACKSHLLVFIRFVDLDGLKNAIQNEKSDQAWWSNIEMINYEKAIKALTGLIFMVLGISILNYGTKLESAITNNNE